MCQIVAITIIQRIMVNHSETLNPSTKDNVYCWNWNKLRIFGTFFNNCFIFHSCLAWLELMDWLDIELFTLSEIIVTICVVVVYLKNNLAPATPQQLTVRPSPTFRHQISVLLQLLVFRQPPRHMTWRSSAIIINSSSTFAGLSCNK